MSIEAAPTESALAWSLDGETDDEPPTDDDAPRIDMRGLARWAALVTLVLILGAATGWLGDDYYQIALESPRAVAAPAVTRPAPHAAKTAPVTPAPSSVAPIKADLDQRGELELPPRPRAAPQVQPQRSAPSPAATPPPLTTTLSDACRLWRSGLSVAEVNQRLEAANPQNTGGAMVQGAQALLDGC